MYPGKGFVVVSSTQGDSQSDMMVTTLLMKAEMEMHFSLPWCMGLTTLEVNVNDFSSSG